MFNLTTLGQIDSIEIDKGDNVGYGIEIGPCTVLFLLTGSSKDKLNDGWCFANVGFYFKYNRFHYILHTGGISSSIKENLTFSENWDEENRFGSLNLELSVGYELFNNRYFNIIPYLSGGLKSFNTRYDSINAEVTKTNLKLSYSLGTAFDFKIDLPIKEENKFLRFSKDNPYLYFRALTGVYPNYLKSPLRINGSLFFINLSLGYCLLL